MNLSDLRKVTVKKHLRIRFPLSNGMECVVNEHGIAQVPALRAFPPSTWKTNWLAYRLL